MEPLNRREFVALAAVPSLLQAAQSKPAVGPGTGKMFVCLHEASSASFDFRTAMEGYAKAGIRAVEPDLVKVREFAQKESPVVARRLLDDLGLKAVSSASQIGLLEPSDQRLLNVEQLKWKVELAQAIGADRLVTPSVAVGTYKADDYTKGVDYMREAAEIARPFGVTLMLEFTKNSRFVACLPTALKLVRECNHPNYRIMMDTYHFWGGISRFEDLQLLRDGELDHLHFEDAPAEPVRELQGQPDRRLPGDGIAPLRQIVEVLKRKKYAGPASLEMFQAATPALQSIDPYQMAMKARAAIEPLIR